MSAKSTTTFTSRGRLTGLIRDEAPAGTGQNRASRAARGEPGKASVDEALYYRARLILGESLPRPNRLSPTRAVVPGPAQGSCERNPPTAWPK